MDCSVLMRLCAKRRDILTRRSSKAMTAFIDEYRRNSGSNQSAGALPIWSISPVKLYAHVWREPKSSTRHPPIAFRKLDSYDLQSLNAHFKTKFSPRAPCPRERTGANRSWRYWDPSDHELRETGRRSVQHRCRAECIRRYHYHGSGPADCGPGCL